MRKDQSSLRNDGLEARRSLTPTEREDASDLIAERISRAHWFQRSNYVACYLPTAEEVNSWPIISRAWRMKKRVFAPVIDDARRMQFHEITPETDLIRNRFGVLEPVDGDIATARMLDIVLTPLVAFDAEKHRIGMGGGYFDTTFAFLKHRAASFRPKLIGLAFDCQKVEKIAPNPWDIRLFSIVTETAAS